MPDAYGTAVDPRDLTHPVRGPRLPGTGSRVPGLEDEPAAVREGFAHAGQTGPQFRVPDQHLKRMPGHHDQVEGALPPLRAEVAEHPLDVGAAPAGLDEHGRGGVEPAQASWMPRAAGPPEQGAGAAADVQHALRGHHKSQVEVLTRAPGVEGVVQSGEGGVGERAVGHPGQSARSAVGLWGLRSELCGSLWYAGARGGGGREPHHGPVTYSFDKRAEVRDAPMR
ncbi:hypothetical protein SAV14893_024520 [Streptomyces avermitilis]|uniref:Uncharacterized protein n=1 Tax=Streptomyces avermitilis TaxID=33903 RepID=A0A4D4LYH3_STRAX|nr:hypothetical protein SAV14893_024520 [Streptomyces avermitilis]